MSSTVEAELDALVRLIKDEQSEHEKYISKIRQEIEEKEVEYQRCLQREFFVKYGESFRDVCIAYMKFFHQDEHLAGTDGHEFYVPIYYEKPAQEIISKHGIHFRRFYHPGTHLHLRPKYYKECLPTLKIIDAFKCIGEEIHIIPKISIVHWGN